MAIPETRANLLADAAAPTLLPADPAGDALVDPDATTLLQVVSAHPESSLGWALLAEESLASPQARDTVSGYAFARTGYHRGLDALRRAGWRGSGPVPWEHEPNRGFLRSLWALAVAADRIGEDDEARRCAQFLRDSSETAWLTLSAAADGA
ncbi:MAG: DUF3151 domain-containing protein [Propioniciclava sp.]